MGIGDEGKKVRATVEPGPNYVFHLLAVAQIGFDGDYGNQYRDTVDERDIECLQRHGDLLRFGNGEQGVLTFLAVFLPAYLNLDSPASMAEYFSLLSAGLLEDDPSDFFDRYADGFARQKKWLYDVDDRWILENHRRYAPEIAQLGEIYARNYPAFEDRVWPTESSSLLEVAPRLNRLLDAEPLIPAWEALTGESFLFNRYEIVLCAANEGGPDANSLGYDRNLFYYARPIVPLFEWVSHEVGTHILIDVFKKMWARGVPDGQRLYWAYENLARHYNVLILGRDLSYHVPEEDAFCDLYRKVHHCQPDATAQQILVAAIDAPQ